MAPRKKATSTANKSSSDSTPPHNGLSFSVLSHIFAPLDIPVLAGISKSAIEDLPPNTIFAAVTDQHWLLGLRGQRATLIFDSLGLPIGALSAIMHGVDFVPWNHYGYQAMHSSVCGYYLIVVVKEIQHGQLLNNGDIDRAFAHVCPFRVARPESMPEWFALHRANEPKLKVNDARVVDYVNRVYPDLAYLDKHHPNLGTGHAGLIGSPLYMHAGIDAPTVHQRYRYRAAVQSAPDPQRAWPGLGEATISSISAPVPPPASGDIRVHPRAEPAGYSFRTVADQVAAPAARHYAGPRRDRPLTRDERILWSRASLNAFASPAGVNADTRQHIDQTPAPPHNRQLNGPTPVDGNEDDDEFSRWSRSFS